MTAEGEILCLRWDATGPLVFGAASRRKAGEGVSGDAVVVQPSRGVAGLIDGVGHGFLARTAAMAVRGFLERRMEAGLEGLFQGAAQVAKATRGVVMTLARFDPAREQVDLAGVGDVEGRLSGVGGAFLPRRGVLGSQSPPPQVSRFPWHSTSILVLHTDGVRPGWTWRDLPEAAWVHPAVTARWLVQAFGRERDDATALVVKARTNGD